MYVAVVIQNEREAPVLLRWAERFARARESQLLVVQPVVASSEAIVDVPLAADSGSDVARAVWSTAEESFPRLLQTGDDPAHLRLREVRAPRARLIDRVLHAVDQDDIGLLIVPRHEPLADPGEAETSLERQLFLRSPCETLLLRTGSSTGVECDRILVPAGGGNHSRLALRLASSLATSEDGGVTALFVQPKVGRDARAVGERILEHTITRALGTHHERVEREVILGNDVLQGIESVWDPDCDLVIVGSSNQGVVRRMLFGSITERLMAEHKEVAMAIARLPEPFTGRIRQAVERVLRRTVPQLTRDYRVQLVEKVQSNSQWDFDFIALVCLSTLIAALGLVTDSGAVVIGAMLVAPFMTPLLGAGLALVQGNPVLIRKAAFSVTSGFLLAFLIGSVLGLLIPGFREATLQMEARGSPSILDLAVAFVSGVAAAYASSRPNLLSALPGVAIAAALVPPIATSGLALTIGRPFLAGGAALLFFTNIVAIVLGTAVALWSVGLRGSHEHGRLRLWTSRVALLLMLVVIALAGGFAYRLYDTLPVAEEVVVEIEATLGREADATCRSVTRTGNHPMRIEVEVEAPARIDHQVATKLAGIASAYYDQAVEIQVVTHLVTRVEVPRPDAATSSP